MTRRAPAKFTAAFTAARLARLRCTVVLACGLALTAPAFGEDSPAGPIWADAADRVVEAVGILARQDSATGRQGSTTAVEAATATATAIAETNRAHAIREARARYESMQSAASGLCGDIAAAREAGMARDLVGVVRESLVEREVAWAREGGQRADVLIATQAVRRSAMCSPAEASRGLCVADQADIVGGFVAGDSDAAPHLLRSMGGRRAYGSAEAEAAMVFGDTLMPLPTMPSEEDVAAGGATAMIERIEARRQMALISIGRALHADLVGRGLEAGLPPTEPTGE